jgi:hypothetical protein
LQLNSFLLRGGLRLLTSEFSGSGMNIPDHLAESLETVFRVLNTCVFSAVFEILNYFLPWIRNGKIRIGYKYPGSGSLVYPNRSSVSLTYRREQGPDPIVRRTDPQIRIRTKMLRIRKTGLSESLYKLFQFRSFVI